MSSPEEGLPEGTPPDDLVAPVESEPVGAEVAQPPAAADDARPPEESSDTEGTGVDSPAPQQEDAGTPEGAGTTEPKAETPLPAPDPATATTPDQPAAAAEEASAVEVPVAEAAPAFDERRSPLLDRIVEEFGDAVVESHLLPGKDLWVRVRTDAWADAARTCRDALGLTYFCFLSAIDWSPSPYGKSEDDSAPASVDPSAPLDHGFAGGETRFQILARLEQPGTSLGVTLKTDVADADLAVPTWTGTFAGADWHEREAHEMFGIGFTGHPHLINLYLPGGFEGFPLRKDFPLLARMVKPWPGLVDVEAMPGEPDEADADADAAAEVPE